MPLLSVIVPIYNGAGYFPRLFESISSNNKNLGDCMEIIAVNDGSNDGSLDLLRNYERIYSNIHVIDKPNGGIASARNVGLLHCKGDYVTFCDQDDILVAGYQSFVNMLQETDSDILIASYTSSNISHSKRICDHDDVYDKLQIDNILKYFMGEHVIITDKEYEAMSLPYIPCSIWNCIFKRNLIVSNDIKIMRYVDYEDDWLFMISTLFYSKRIVVTNSSFYCWTVNPKSESHTSKYIEDFFAKREQLNGYLFQLLQFLHVTKERLGLFRNKVDAQTVLWGFYNESGNPVSSYMDRVHQLENYTNFSKYRQFNLGRMSRLYFFLLQNRFYKIAYYINSCTFKRHYH